MMAVVPQAHPHVTTNNPKKTCDNPRANLPLLSLQCHALWTIAAGYVGGGGAKK